jgi:DNA-binding LytR/AlgR family response regulator
VQAFEAQAVDYLLNPVMPERLARTVAPLQQALALRGPDTAGAWLEHTLT